jgi:WD40 repeat protein
LLAAAYFDGTVRLWNVADGTERALLTGHTDVMTGCTFSPDGALLATASNDGIVRLWQVTSGRCIALYAWRVL